MLCKPSEQLQKTHNGVCYGRIQEFTHFYLPALSDYKKNLSNKDVKMIKTALLVTLCLSGIVTQTKVYVIIEEILVTLNASQYFLTWK